MSRLSYCDDLLHYERRLSREVMVGRVGVGGANPIRVQSMITCDTMDTEASIAQTLELAAVGLRDRAHHRADGEGRGEPAAHRRGLRARGCDVPIVADIHFKPEAAMEAAKWVEKVRINPGNYADSKKFAIIEYTDEQYAAELERIRERFTPLVKLCRERGLAMRIGTNHGSLSDRIMNRYGDTPLGMVESALEFARIARDLDYHDFIFSMKSSNPKVMIECLPPARRAAATRKATIGITRFTSASPKRAKARTGGSRARSASARSCATASATRSAFRSPKTASTKSRSRGRWSKSRKRVRTLTVTARNAGDAVFPSIPFPISAVPRADACAAVTPKTIERGGSVKLWRRGN